MVEKEEEVLLIPDTAALIINRSEIKLPNIFRNELENEFELIYDEYEDDIELEVYMGLKPISNEFKIFLVNQENNYYGYSYQEEALGNLSESLAFFTKD